MNESSVSGILSTNFTSIYFLSSSS